MSGALAFSFTLIQLPAVSRKGEAVTATTTMEIEHAGARLGGVIAKPEGTGPFPAVLIFHSGRGFIDFYRDMPMQIAGHGYLAVACDMFGTHVDISSADRAGPAFNELRGTPGKLRERVNAWFDTVSAMPDVDESRIGAIGFCLGGECVLELARSGADAKAVVSFHGLLTTTHPARSGDVRARVAAYCARHDPYAPMEHLEAFRAEMEEAGIAYDLMLFGTAEHGFTDPDSVSLNRPGISFDRIADKVSWAGALALLKEVLRPDD